MGSSSKGEVSWIIPLEKSVLDLAYNLLMNICFVIKESLEWITHVMSGSLNLVLTWTSPFQGWSGQANHISNRLFATDIGNHIPDTMSYHEKNSSVHFWTWTYIFVHKTELELDSPRVAFKGSRHRRFLICLWSSHSKVFVKTLKDQVLVKYSYVWSMI